MARDLLSPVGILDDTHGTVARVAAPWIGVLWLFTMPYRFAQAYFIRELVDLGRKAPEFGGYLERLAWILFALFLPAVYGRCVYVRVCSLELQSGARVGREGWRVSAVHLLHSLYVGLLLEVLFALTVWTFFAAPLLALPSGLVYVAATRSTRPSLFSTLSGILQLMSGLKAVLGLVATFLLALPAAFVNVYAALRGGLWALTALGGDGLTRWEHLLRPIHPNVPLLPGEMMTILICIAGALLIVEPFWLAALTVYAQRTQLKQSGEDLRLRFRLLTGEK